MNNNNFNMTIFNVLKYSEQLLSHVKTPKLDAEILLSYVLKKSRVWIKLFDDFILNQQQINIYKKLLIRRIQYEPISYIIKKKEFWSLSFMISKHVFIPRPETEILVQETLNRSFKNAKILDLGTGSGIIPISISHEIPKCNILGIDCNIRAISLAKKNSKNLNCQNVFFMYSNWFSCIQDKFDIIVSNPPYLKHQDISDISQDLLYEPYIALFSQNNGISDIQYIIENAKNYLFYRGWLLIEHAYSQNKKIVNIFQKNNFCNIQSYKDYSNIVRVTLGQKLF